jgi:hypothetical protein
VFAYDGGLSVIPRSYVRAMELWSPPRDTPHLFEWWRPLVQASRRARAERLPWPVHVDEFRLAGRVIRRGRPDVWIYEHHANGGSLCVDATGGAYRFVATPGAAEPEPGPGCLEGDEDDDGVDAGGAVGQFRQCSLVEGLRRAGLPEVVGRVSYRPPLSSTASPTSGSAPQPHAGPPAPGPPAPPTPAAPAEPGRPDESQRGVIRRRHLTLVAGCA